MNKYLEEVRFPERKNPRTKEINYSRRNYYFITICTCQKQCIFGSPMALNQLGKIAEESLLETQIHYPGIRIDKYVIMPNHIHVIYDVMENGSDLINAIAAFKASTTRKARKIKPDLMIWQRSFHDHVIRNQKSYEKIWNYIEGNPYKWEEDCFYMSD